MNLFKKERLTQQEIREKAMEDINKLQRVQRCPDTGAFRILKGRMNGACVEVRYEYINGIEVFNWTISSTCSWNRFVGWE